MEILILNGPNLNLLGTRQPEIYGSKTMDEVIAELREKYPDQRIHHFQSNHEGALIDKLHEVGFHIDGIILNAGGYSHTSIALGDAIKSINSPVIELHISDINKREAFRKHSYIKENAVHHVIGKGVAGYEEALLYFIES